MLVKKIIQRVLEVAVAFTPKYNWCVLRGFPDYDDNRLAIYERLADYGCIRIVWVVANPAAPSPFALRSDTLVVRQGSLQDYFYSTFAKYLFITHGHFIKSIPRNQICINLWHGIPYKVIGKLDGKPGRNDSMVIATSELTRDVFARVFGVASERVVATGQARTDRMFVDRTRVRAQLALPDWPTKVFLWLPTYRKTSMAGGRMDGHDSGNVFNCSGFPAAEFDAWLKANDAVCVVKPHPMAPPVETAGTTTNLIYIDDNWLRAKGVTLYQLAGASDCLVSDISSIVADFMLLDRPIVLLFEDIVEYRSSRGFVFAPIEDWLPARVNVDYAGFIDDMTAVLAGEDRYELKRARLKRAFFDHADAQSTKRILDLAFGRNAVSSAD